MAIIRINDLPDEAAPLASDVVAIDGASTRKTDIVALVDSARPFASQAEAEAGVIATKAMSPLTTKQSIADEIGTPGAAGLSILADATASDTRDFLDTAPYVPTRTVLKALDTTKDTVAYLTESGREGQFVWTTGDFSAEVTADTLEGIYVKADAIAATVGAWVRVYDGRTVDIRWFGAAVDDTADDGPAINAAILSLPVTGGTVLIPGICRTTVPIDIGDGIGTDFDPQPQTPSTRYGVRLEGFAPPTHHQGQSPEILPVACGIRYDGVTTGAMVVHVHGPLAGWAIRNLEIDGGGADYGLFAYFAEKGDTDNLVFKNCRISYALDSCGQTRGGNILIYMPNVDSAVGMIFDGRPDGATSTCFVDLNVLRVYMQGGVVATNNSGIIFKVADGVTLMNVLVFTGSPADATTRGVLYDYTGNSVFPCGNTIYMPDIGWNLPAAQQYVVAGTPVTGARPNHLFGLSEVNGGKYPTNVLNLLVDLPKKVCSDVAAVNQTAAIGFTNMHTITDAGMYRLNWYLVTSVAGTGGTSQPTIAFNDGVIGQGVILGATAINLTVLGNHIAGSELMRIAAGTNLAYSVNYSGTGGAAYSFYATLERLN